MRSLSLYAALLIVVTAPIEIVRSDLSRDAVALLRVSANLINVCLKTAHAAHIAHVAHCYR
jgi:hypothetical protein